MKPLWPVDGHIPTGMSANAERTAARVSSKWVMVRAWPASGNERDEESRVAAMMYLALYSDALHSDALQVSGKESRPNEERDTEIRMMQTTVLEQLKLGPLSDAIDPLMEKNAIDLVGDRSKPVRPRSNGYRCRGLRHHRLSTRPSIPLTSRSCARPNCIPLSVWRRKG